MELKAEVLIRNKNTGSETILCTGIDPASALKWVELSMKTMDFNAMPEYVIRPLISNTAPARKGTKYADRQKEVIKVPESEI